MSGVSRVSGRLCLLTVVGTAAMGALSSPALATLVGAPLAGLFVASQVALVHPGFPAQPSARRAVLLAGAGCALGVPFVMGATALGTTGAVLTMIVITTGAVSVAGRLTELCRDDEVSRPTAQDTRVLGELIGAVPMSTLLEEWRLSEAVLATATDPDERSAASLAREMLLDEMTRRDPAGVRRWLQDDAAASPDRHLRDDAEPTG
jgi:hypothetical protein